MDTIQPIDVSDTIDYYTRVINEYTTQTSTDINSDNYPRRIFDEIANCTWDDFKEDGTPLWIFLFILNKTVSQHYSLTIFHHWHAGLGEKAEALYKFLAPIKLPLYRAAFYGQMPVPKLLLYESNAFPRIASAWPIYKTVLPTPRKHSYPAQTNARRQFLYETIYYCIIHEVWPRVQNYERYPRHNST